jgi:O-antigen/teichoic acid export membrane protein
MLSPTAWVTIERLTQQVLWLILFVILAPILGPRPYGLYAIVMVFVGFSEQVLIESATEALVTVDKLDNLHATTANLATGAIALAVSLVMCLFAPALGGVFHDDEISHLVWILAPLPVLSALSAPPIAVLRRSQQFKLLAVRTIAGLTIGGVFGIVLALAGAGVWALALQVLGQRVAELTIAWMSVPIRPGLRWSGTHFGEMRSVLLNVSWARLMNFGYGNIPRLIIGYMLGATELGLFNLAARFIDIIVSIAVLPRASVGRIELRHSKPGSAEFVTVFQSMVQDASFLSIPMFLGAAALTPELFQVWLDQRWQAGVIPTQLMLLLGLPLVLFTCIDSALLAANLSTVFRRMASIQAWTSIATVLIVAPFGLNAICLSLAVRQWVCIPVFLLMFRRPCHMPDYDFLRAPLRSLIGATIMAGFLNLHFLRPSWLPLGPALIVLVSVGVMFYAVFSYCFSRDQLKAILGGFFVPRH